MKRERGFNFATVGLLKFVFLSMIFSLVPVLANAQTPPSPVTNPLAPCMFRGGPDGLTFVGKVTWTKSPTTTVKEYVVSHGANLPMVVERLTDFDPAATTL